MICKNCKKEFDKLTTLGFCDECSSEFKRELDALSEKLKSTHLLINSYKKEEKEKSKYKANFLWPYEDDSIEEAGYEFANGAIEEYRKLWWDILIKRISDKKG